jgi:hypothetical protein
MSKALRPVADPAKDTDTLLAALERQIERSAQLAAAAREGINHHTFAPYRKFRGSVDEYQALCTLIEERLEKVAGPTADPARERLFTLQREMLALLIRSSLEFFFGLSAIPLLPFGVRELFAEELHSLYDTQSRLRQPEHQGKCPESLEQDLGTAELILLEVMEKAPSLVNFDIGEAEAALAKPEAGETEDA